MNEAAQPQPAETKPEDQASAAPEAAPKVPPSQDPNHFVVRVQSYVDVNGRQVDDRVTEWGPAPEGFVRFFGVGDVVLKYPDGRTQGRTARFPLHGAADLKGAFDAYDAAFDAVSVDIQKQFDEQLAKYQAQAEQQQKEMQKQAQAQRGQPWRPPGGGRIIAPGR
jgi:hypothetical protein